MEHYKKKLYSCNIILSIAHAFLIVFGTVSHSCSLVMRKCICAAPVCGYWSCYCNTECCKCLSGPAVCEAVHYWICSFPCLLSGLRCLMQDQNECLEYSGSRNLKKQSYGVWKLVRSATRAASFSAFI